MFLIIKTKPKPKAVARIWFWRGHGRFFLGGGGGGTNRVAVLPFLKGIPFFWPKTLFLKIKKGFFKIFIRVPPYVFIRVLP